MSTPVTSASSASTRRPSTVTMLLMVGSLMTMAALATDVMLPAFPTMAEELGVSSAAIQRVMTVFMIGYALPHLLVGSAADQYGRRPVLVTGLVVYAIGSVVCLVADGFTGLLIGRFIQGLGCAAGSVLARAVLRDLYSGRELGRMLSFAMIVFTAAPLLAPSIGAMLLQLGDWHLLFIFLLIVAGLMLVMVLRMLPETLRHFDPNALSLKGLRLNASRLFSDPRSAWSIVVLTLIYGCLMAYLASTPTIFIEHYGLSETQFGLVFASIAAISFLSQPLNARLLTSFTPVQILRVVLPLFLIVCLALVIQTATGADTIWSFAVNFMAFFACFSITMANTMSMVLEPHQERAGMAAGISGFGQLGVGTLIGSVIAYFATGGPFALALGIVILIALAVPAFFMAARAYSRLGIS